MLAGALALTDCSRPNINENLTDTEALAKMEAFIAESVAADDEPFTIPEPVGDVPPENDHFTDNGPGNST
ncbi:hypothetical protein [Glycomyces sp. NRRL B-16210]|uniref:hypothetical protein n=1 Tax=Glycomyces sp. NRRL B-16210 TaxID=1463821 RepID=UPI0004C0B0E3|nr:hypothetical protein [Glycomyces sp. NRRL B-16210]